jgi:hypothetical protein
MTASHTLEDTPLPKRPRRSRVMTRKAKEVKETSGRLDTHEKKETLRHAFPRYYRNKDWRVEDLDEVYLTEDGSLQCVVRWEPTVVAGRGLTGALRERCEELFKEKFGAEEWEKWLEMQGTPGRRTKSTRRG